MTYNIDWSDPTARLRLVEEFGTEEYNKALAAHHQDTTIEVVNGYPLRRVFSPFGNLIAVTGTPQAFRTLEAASNHAKSLPPA